MHIVFLSHWLLVQHVFVASYLAQRPTHMERDIEPCKQKKKCPAPSRSSEVISLSFWGNPSIILPYSICLLVWSTQQKNMCVPISWSLHHPQGKNPSPHLWPVSGFGAERSCTVHRWRKLCAVPAPWNSTNLPSASGGFVMESSWCSMENLRGPTPQWEPY